MSEYDKAAYRSAQATTPSQWLMPTCQVFGRVDNRKINHSLITWIFLVSHCTYDDMIRRGLSLLTNGHPNRRRRTNTKALEEPRSHISIIILRGCSSSASRHEGDDRTHDEDDPSSDDVADGRPKQWSDCQSQCRHCNRPVDL